MNWCDERYVRLYTRDTVTWLSLSLEAQGLLGLILRKLDRAGVLELGGIGKRGVAVALGHGSRWAAVEPALDELLSVRVMRLEEDRLVMPNFLEAQEAKQSDRVRQAESRARRRAHGVTPRDDESRSVTERHDSSPAVTPEPPLSHEVTPSVPCRAVPSVPKENVGLAPNEPAPLSLALVEPKGPTARQEAEAWVEWFNRRFARRFEVSRELLEFIGKLVRAGYSQEDMRAVAIYQREQWKGDGDMDKYLRPSTLLRFDNFKRYVVDAREWLATQRGGGRGAA